MKTVDAIQKVKEGYEWSENGHIMFDRLHNVFMFNLNKGNQRVSIKLEMNDRPPRFDAMGISYRGDKPEEISRKQVSLDDSRNMSVIKLVTELYQKSYEPKDLEDTGRVFSFTFTR